MREDFGAEQRKGDMTAIAVVVVVFGAIVFGILAMKILDECRDCERRGGVMVRGVLGYECVAKKGAR